MRNQDSRLLPLQNQSETVSIRPGVSVLSVLKHLNYKPWYALAEFVDNSIQSTLQNLDELRSKEGEDYVLKVDIELEEYDEGRIIIRDNAAGIKYEDYHRAFRPAEIPPDRSGLAEFGMGMKSAACWFSPQWSVRTSALGENVQREIRFNIEEIITDSVEELTILTTEEGEESHYTEITLTALHKLPSGRTLSKIKEHLTDIYRVFIREGILQLTFKGDVLDYEEPPILEAPMYNANNEPEGDPLVWRVSLDDFDFGDELKATGFAALRAEGSTKYSGFSLFRRNRVIEGSADEKYRPQHIFGAPNSYVYQRLFGEIHLEGFDVSHTKDGFRWDENEMPFLELLKERLNQSPLPLLRQANNYRANPPRREVEEVAEQVTERTVMSLSLAREAIEKTFTDQVEEGPPESVEDMRLVSTRYLDLDFENKKWRIVLEMSDESSVGDFISLSESVIENEDGGGRELLGVRVSLSHPFMRRFVGIDSEKLEPVIRLVAAFALSEKLARDAGVRRCGTMRLRFNKIIKDALSRG